jgi:hypothetical protein
MFVIIQVTQVDQVGSQDFTFLFGERSAAIDIIIMWSQLRPYTAMGGVVERVD